MLSSDCSFFFQELVISQERHAYEDLTMTLLQVMTSSGILTSRNCRLILEEFKSEVRF